MVPADSHWVCSSSETMSTGTGVFRTKRWNSAGVGVGGSWAATSAFLSNKREPEPSVEAPYRELCTAGLWLGRGVWGEMLTPPPASWKITLHSKGERKSE